MQTWLRWLDIFGSDKGDSFCDFLFAFAYLVPTEKEKDHAPKEE